MCPGPYAVTTHRGLHVTERAGHIEFMPDRSGGTSGSR